MTPRDFFKHTIACSLLVDPLCYTTMTSASKPKAHSTSSYLSSYLIIHHPNSSYLILPHPTSSYLLILHPTSSYFILLHRTSSYPPPNSSNTILPHPTPSYLIPPPSNLILLHLTSSYLILLHCTSEHEQARANLGIFRFWAVRARYHRFCEEFIEENETFQK